MTKRETIVDFYSDCDDIVFADGFDEAIIGFDPNLWKVVYSREKCIEIVMKDSEYTGAEAEMEAIEYLEYNTFNTYIGDKTPVWVDTLDWVI